jgi:PEP-CTERM motif
MKTTANNRNCMSPIALINQPGKILLLVLLALGCFTLHAQPSALTGFYTQVAAGDPDFGSNPEILPVGLVQGQLGPNGLPVLNSSGIATLGTSDINPITSELLWWSPGQADPYVSGDLNPVEVDTLPMNFGYPNAWYPTGQSDDSSFFRTVHWQGTFDLATAGSISLDISVDDDSWTYIDGTLVNEDHYGFESDTTTDLSGGVHSIDIFYDDRQPDFDGFNLTSSVPLSPVPEPSTVALFAAGAFGFLVCGWRRRKQLAG